MSPTVCLLPVFARHCALIRLCAGSCLCAWTCKMSWSCYHFPLIPGSVHVYQVLVSLGVTLDWHSITASIYQIIVSLHQIIYYFLQLYMSFIENLVLSISFMLHSFSDLLCSVPCSHLLLSEPVLLPASVAVPISGPGPSGCTAERYPISISLAS